MEPSTEGPRQAEEEEREHRGRLESLSVEIEAQHAVHAEAAGRAGVSLGRAAAVREQERVVSPASVVRATIAAHSQQ